ncbi:hypothetical protein [Crocosphaera chwakensis]|uniref:Uncharacterized protein n=1 Tax=Crocosphaera chwakensis CCY0110 TaxID=391612 RepID=A3IZF1_9CHRO|nr:hypothetical protein [Crocosphaera chwakensis]EAZ88139.1 hypothetical protein CY0110_30985 [Crocosphaera chwakensis CCY0110]
MNNIVILSVLLINQIGFIKAQLPTTNFVQPQNLKVGTYLAQGTINNNSWRYILRQDNRFCLEIANGPASPYAGTIEVIVSSLSVVNNKVKVDATGQYITKEKSSNVNYYSFDEADRPWEWIRSELFNSSPELLECLKVTMFILKKDVTTLEAINLSLLLTLMKNTSKQPYKGVERNSYSY